MWGKSAPSGGAEAGVVTAEAAGLGETGALE